MTTLDVGTAEYRRVSWLLFFAGGMAFCLLYVVQGILPAVSKDFGVSPALASLTLSLTTLPLAVAVVFWASVSEGQGRRHILIQSVIGASVLTVVAAFSGSFVMLLGARILTGVVLAGLPAVAMAYVAEEFTSGGLGRVMGLYISGTGLGGLVGRLVGGLVAGSWSWQAALVVTGSACLVGSLVISRMLPHSANFVPTELPMHLRLRRMEVPARHGTVLRLALVGFAAMGSLVSLFNYLQYRLHEHPFDLTPRAIALVYLLYLAGTVSSNTMGHLSDRLSPRPIVRVGLLIMLAGALVTLSSSTVVVLAGTAVVVFGFFGTHAVASSWVSAWTGPEKAQASAVYLFCYQLGSSVMGFVGGIFFGHFGWRGEVSTIVVLMLVALAATVRLSERRGIA